MTSEDTDLMFSDKTLCDDDQFSRVPARAMGLRARAGERQLPPLEVQPNAHTAAEAVAG